jgi:hypothetical protein
MTLDEITTQKLDKLLTQNEIVIKEEGGFKILEFYNSN